VPAGVKAGQYLLASVAVVNGTEAVTGPPGWTKVADTPVATTNGAHLVTFSRWADGTEAPSYRFSWTSPTAGSAGMLALAGVNPSNPLDGAPQAATAGLVTASWTGPPITTSSANDVLVSCWSTQGGYDQTPDPADVERFDVYGAGPPINDYVSCDTSGPVAPGTYARTVRSSASGIGVDGVTQILALRPAGSSASGV
jgi:hypothetical protein